MFSHTFTLLISVLIAVAWYKYPFSEKSQAVTVFDNEQDTQEIVDMSGNVVIRPFGKLGGANHGWLNTRHHFSFADYFDPQRMNWGALRVINDDIVQPGAGFPPHPHRSMEIVTFILKPNLHPGTGRVEGGEGIRHRDNTGSDGVTMPGDVQVMSVGTEGVAHSEFHPNSSSSKTSNFFQIWIMPDHKVEKTTWGTRHFPREDTANKFITFASGLPEDKGTDALPINSATRVVGVTLTKGGKATYKLGKNRLAYAVLGLGDAKVNGIQARAHDGIAIKDTEELTFTTEDEAEVLLIDTHP